MPHESTPSIPSANIQVKQPPASGEKPWTILLSVTFLESNTMMSDRAYRVFTSLEAYARENRGCFPSNAAIARLTGKSKSAVSRILAELEDSGFIKLESKPGCGKARQSITMLRRTDTRVPSAKTPKGIGENAYGHRRKRLSPIGENAQHNKDALLNKEAINKDAGEGGRENPTRPSPRASAFLNPLQKQIIDLAVRRWGESARVHIADLMGIYPDDVVTAGMTRAFDKHGIRFEPAYIRKSCQGIHADRARVSG